MPNFQITFSPEESNPGCVGLNLKRAGAVCAAMQEGVWCVSRGTKPCNGLFLAFFWACFADWREGGQTWNDTFNIC